MTLTSSPTGTTAPSLQRLATWVFVAAPVFGSMRLPTGEYLYPRVGAIALVSMAFLFLLAIHAHAFPARTLVTVTGAAALFFGLLTLYSLSWDWIRGSAYGEPSITLGIAAASYCSVAVLYRCVFYREDILLDVFWKASSLAVAIALAAYLAYALTGSEWLVHREYGTPRLQGFMSEPSGWGPFLPALVLLSLQRRRYVATVIFVTAVALAKSPTVLLVFAISVPAYYILTKRRSSRRILALASVAVFGALAAYTVQTADATTGLSSSVYSQSVARLVAGIQNVASGGTQGRNDRFAATQTVVGELVDHGWLATGIGPGSEGYMHQATGVLPYSLPVYALSSFGVAGLLILIAMLFLTITRLRTSRSFGLFLPFIVASLINSAAGWESYKFVVVAIAVAVCMRRSVATANNDQNRPVVRTVQLSSAQPDNPGLVPAAGGWSAVDVERRRPRGY